MTPTFQYECFFKNMKNMRVILVTFLLLVSFEIFPQSNSGTIVDAATKKALPYVNIGILNRALGTVSDNEGRFIFAIDEQYNGDSLKISAVGYEARVFTVSEFRRLITANPVIELSEKPILLKEIVISDKKLKEKKRGNMTTSAKLRGGFSNSQLGNELGIVIKVGKKPERIKQFHASVVSNKIDGQKFRLNFYDVKRGLPHTRLVSEQIVFPITTASGVFTLDLTDYNIVMTDDFFLSLELVENPANVEKGGVFFSAGLFGHPVIVRDASQGEWEKFKAISIGFSVTTEY